MSTESAQVGAVFVAPATLTLRGQLFRIPPPRWGRVAAPVRAVPPKWPIMACGGGISFQEYEFHGNG